MVLLLALRLRLRLPSFALQRAVAVLSGWLYWKGPGHAWMGLSAAVPGLAELLAAIEAIWIACAVLPGMERYPARAFASLIGLCGAVVALLGDPVPYPMPNPTQWYARSLLHVQETLACAAALAYVIYSAGVAWRWQLAHVALMAAYLGTDAWANAQPAGAWWRTDAALMWIHLGCAACWVVVLSLARGARAIPRSSDSPR